MNPGKSSLFIFLVIAGICILSILASPSLTRRQELNSTSTTESPVDDEDGPESDQLTNFKRSVPVLRQQRQLHFNKNPWNPCEKSIDSSKRSIRYGGISHSSPGSFWTASDQLTIFKRDVPEGDQEVGSTTEQTFPSDQMGFVIC